MTTGQMDLTPKQAAARLNRSPITLETWRRRRIGPPFYRICGRVSYPADELEGWIQQQKQATRRAGV